MRRLTSWMLICSAAAGARVGTFDRQPDRYFRHNSCSSSTTTGFIAPAFAIHRPQSSDARCPQCLHACRSGRRMSDDMGLNCAGFPSVGCNDQKWLQGRDCHLTLPFNNRRHELEQARAANVVARYQTSSLLPALERYAQRKHC